jgi:glycosyltransferase involved in cell wall biosynthesis
MACATPVVASRIAAIPEVVLDGGTGLLFEPGDASDLAAKLSTLLDDDELRSRLGAAGPGHVARFTWDVMTAFVREAVDGA